MINPTNNGLNNKVYEDYDFNIISLNVRGLNNKKKRLSVFRYLKKENCDIAFLPMVVLIMKQNGKMIGVVNVFLHMEGNIAVVS